MLIRHITCYKCNRKSLLHSSYLISGTTKTRDERQQLSFIFHTSSPQTPTVHPSWDDILACVSKRMFQWLDLCQPRTCQTHLQPHAHDFSGGRSLILTVHSAGLFQASSSPPAELCGILCFHVLGRLLFPFPCTLSAMSKISAVASTLVIPAPCLLLQNRLSSRTKSQLASVAVH